MIENIKKVSERATWQIFKRSAYWDLRESSERCLVYEQNDWLEKLMLQVYGLSLADAQKNTSKDCYGRDNNNNNNNNNDNNINNSSSILCFLGDPELRKSFNRANLRRGNLSRNEQLQVYYLLQTWVLWWNR